MGILYKEVVQYKHYRNIKFIFNLIFILLTMNTVYLLINFKNKESELLYINYGILPLSILTLAFLYIKFRKKYRYNIIDNELIIERLKGEKSDVVLNFNIKHIVKMGKVTPDLKNERVDREYNFICSGKRRSAYYCTFKNADTMCRFYFEPSEELLKKLNMLSLSTK